MKDNANIAEGTVIATFNSEGRYLGHAAIYVSQDKTKGIKVFDQWVNGIPRPIHERDIKWDGGPSVSNKGDAFYVVEPT